VKVLLTGANGQLGTDLQTVFGAPGHHQVLATDVATMDITDRGQVLGVTGAFAPDIVIHAGAWTAVDACEGDPDRAWQVNALGSRHVAEGAREAGAHLVYVSTDYVFDGTSRVPYTEWDVPHPASAYGRSKLAGEVEVLDGCPGAAVVRTAWVCGVHGANMVKTVLRLAAERDRLTFVDDQHGCPTFTDDLAGMLYRLAVARRPGRVHVTNQGPTTWFQFARDIVAAAGRDPGMVDAVSTADLAGNYPAPRPANSVLDNAALRLSGVPLLPDHHEPLERTVRALVG
jgi:dTDP-4-dehydrorhamnose reductase